MVPEVNSGGFRLPDTGIVDARQADECAVFGPEGDVLVGFGHDGGFAGDRVADHAEAVLGADDEGVETVEIVETGFERLAEVLAFLQFLADIGGGDFGIVLVDAAVLVDGEGLLRIDLDRLAGLADEGPAAADESEGAVGVDGEVAGPGEFGRRLRIGLLAVGRGDDEEPVTGRRSVKIF